MKKLLLCALMAALCLVVAGCDKDTPAPEELQTPQYAVSESESEDLPAPEASEIHKSANGVKVIVPPKMDHKEINIQSGEKREADKSVSPPAHTPIADTVTPATVWENDAVVTYNAFTLPEKAAFDDGSLGVLSIAKINLTVNVYESDNQMEDMEHGVAHFKSTSAWDGNIAIVGHNSTVSGYGAYFRDLYQLAAGDSVMYKTALGEREYIVTTVKTIDETDWSALGRTADNRLTLITCVNNNAAKRLLVQAVQA